MKFYTALTWKIELRIFILIPVECIMELLVTDEREFLWIGMVHPLGSILGEDNGYVRREVHMLGKGVLFSFYPSHMKYAATPQCELLNLT